MEDTNDPSANDTLNETKESMGISNKRERSSPTDPSSIQRSKKGPGLRLLTNSKQSVRSYFTVPSPSISSPKIQGGFVITPSKNEQITHIISDE